MVLARDPNRLLSRTPCNSEALLRISDISVDWGEGRAAPKQKYLALLFSRARSPSEAQTSLTSPEQPSPDSLPLSICHTKHTTDVYILVGGRRLLGQETKLLLPILFLHPSIQKRTLKTNNARAGGVFLQFPTEVFSELVPILLGLRHQPGSHETCL